MSPISVDPADFVLRQRLCCHPRPTAADMPTVGAKVAPMFALVLAANAGTCEPDLSPVQFQSIAGQLTGWDYRCHKCCKHAGQMEPPMPPRSLEMQGWRELFRAWKNCYHMDRYDDVRSSCMEILTHQQ